MDRQAPRSVPPFGSNGSDADAGSNSGSPPKPAGCPTRNPRPEPTLSLPPVSVSDVSVTCRSGRACLVRQRLCFAKANFRPSTVSRAKESGPSNVKSSPARMPISMFVRVQGPGRPHSLHWAPPASPPLFVSGDSFGLVKVSSQKPPRKPKDIWAIRIHLQNAHAVRELAMFNLAIDSKLRGCDLVSLRVRDVTHGSQVLARAIVIQRKTQRPVQFELTEPTRDAVAA